MEFKSDLIISCANSPYKTRSLPRTSQAFVSVFLSLIIGNENVQHWGGFLWQHVCAKVCAEGERGMDVKSMVIS
jgi:hypothetical protein